MAGDGSTDWCFGGLAPLGFPAPQRACAVKGAVGTCAALDGVRRLWYLLSPPTTTSPPAKATGGHAFGRGAAKSVCPGWLGHLWSVSDTPEGESPGGPTHLPFTSHIASKG